MSIKVRIGMIVGIMCTALLSLIAAPGAAFAAACSTYGCDGTNPDYMPWNGSAVTRLGPITNGSGVTVALRSGTANGGVYAWARMTYYSGSDAHLTYVYIERCTKDHMQCTSGLGTKAGGTSGWTSQVGTNSYSTWSGVYYDSGLVARACVYDSTNGSTTCTGWW
ncbi:hypothetical protein [Streptomyces sp. NBC_00572]|uniref:hypothetical protein n=1 Tax=Streptomyces sp. NBC_00572 TaxID=2903664 RepID=UPI00224E815C|nr:hypothetical protein [Streptomyces sp. NBC_00572]MCX4983237.1 hypothetical protein [Streptomyces sp. NBC_00572]